MRFSEIQRAKTRAEQCNEHGRDRRFSSFWAPVGLVAGVVILIASGLIAAVGPGSAHLTHAAGNQQPVATVAADSPSGEPMPVGDIPGWHQVFADDFTTDVPLGRFPGAVADKWDSYKDGWTDSSGNGTYYPSKVISIRNGVLNMFLHTENGVHMVAAPEPKIPGAVGREGGLLYGRYVIRFRSDPIYGYKAAWLLWPDSESWPRDGEIDFPEGHFDNVISAFMHHQDGTSDGDQDEFGSLVSFRLWHTAVTEWTPSSVTFILDGQTIGTATTGIPNTPMHWVLQTETATDGVVPSDTSSGNVQIDWVAVYVPANTPVRSPTTPPATPAALIPTSAADASTASTIESLAVMAGISTMVVAFLSTAFAYTTRVRKKARVQRRPGSSLK